MILVTGSEGLIGRNLVARLTKAGLPCRGFDVRRSMREDVREVEALGRALDGVTGIVHLAAVSRVVWAERDPELTQAVNVIALERLLDLAIRAPARPWLIFGSSREVYGEQASLPVNEAAALGPLNTYARCKVRGEELTAAAAHRGMVANICRFSNVYGCRRDHEDRVVPAFARAAALGGTICVEGADHVFDFTHVLDVARGLELAVRAARAGKQLPPIHFVTGHPCSLGQLAELAQRECGADLAIVEKPARTYDVARFFGDPARARSLLGWEAKTLIDQGFAELTRQFRLDVDQSQKSVSVEGKLSWTHPKITTFAARDAEARPNFAGPTDAGIYHS
jgi:nucleoside-diphosphate-sugar epimerase